MKTLSFESCEDRIVLAGDLTGALADATSKIAEFDFEQERVVVNYSVVKDGALFMSLKAEAFDGLSSDVQLWSTDGTEEGSNRIATISSGGPRSEATDLVFLGDKAYFFVDAWKNASPDGNAIPELWETNGEASGTKLVKAFEPSKAGFEAQLYAYDSKLVITLTDYSFGGGSSSEVWLSDGTAEGTSLLGPTFHQDMSGAAITELVEFDGKLLFGAGTARPDPNLPTVDPGFYSASVDGVELIRTFEGGGLHPILGANSLTLLGDTVMFWASDGETGYELWRTDSTFDGTQLVRDINLDPEAPCPLTCLPGSVPQHLTNVNGTLMFTAVTPEHGRELWKSDGTEAGTTLVADISPGSASTVFSTPSIGGPDPVLAVGDLFYFVTLDGRGGNTLWRSDGTAEGTFSVALFEPASANAGSVRLRHFTEADGKLFFSVADGSDSTQIWMSDGTEEGTRLAVSVGTGPSTFSGWPSEIIPLDDSLIFISGEVGEPSGIWKIDLSQELTNTDVNGNGITDFADFLVITSNFGKEVSGGLVDGDIDGDGVVMFSDFLLMSRAYGTRQ